ncbi:MAG TPA: helix-turn-helix domain-containing protein [Noviherbaspirillum sp.]|nr:helix-turn-helix domain-containing protein [Noviherbaspirillum sp.]
MPLTYPIRISAQLRPHLRALRKKRGLTQAQVGELLGVSQARVAEIEANPGLVSFEQMLQLLSVLDAALALQEEGPAVPGTGELVPSRQDTKAEKGGHHAHEMDTAPKEPRKPDPHKDAPPTSRRNTVILRKKGFW